MPNKDAGFAEFVVSDLFDGIPGVKARAMFGGYGISKDGLTFGLIAEGRLYLKVDDTNRADYENAGSSPFTYAMKDGSKSVMSYWELPEAAMEKPSLAAEWAKKAIAIARRKKQVKK